MAEAADEKIAEGKLDLVPMIDCIMLLLLFFILTTKFTSEEKSISSLLPTDKGQAPSTPQKKVEPPQTVNICIYPADMFKGSQPSGFQKQLEGMRQPGAVIPRAFLRVGNRDPIEINGKLLGSPDKSQVKVEMEKVHTYIREELEKFEVPGDRKTQNEIVVNCFSGMSWKYGLVAYDAVRSYEGQKSGLKYTGNPAELDNARAVTFAPPRIRDYDSREIGNELFEIINMK